jgi:hypothetical protein
MSALADALRAKFKTPAAAVKALGLDESLLEDGGGITMPMSLSAARAIARSLKRRGMLAMDASEEETARELQRTELEGDRRRVDDRHYDGRDWRVDDRHRADDLEANAGVPPWLAEHRDDGDAEFEQEAERVEDACADRRADDLRARLGHEASDEEWEREEEEEEFKPDESETLDRRADDRGHRADDALDRRRRAHDRARARRAADAKAKLGRDETEEETAAREKEEEAEDRRHARDRARLGRDYRRARDRHHRALDRLRRHADDYRRADDARRAAMDAKRAGDAARADDERRRHADDARRAYDEVCAARDARRTARDRRRAHDRRHGMDEPPEFRGMPKPGGEMVSKSAMDAAIQQALRDNDFKHRAIAEAIEVVRPKVGKIALDSAIQGEGDVYARALDVLGVGHAGITQLAALKQMFALASAPSRETRTGGFAQDAAPAAKASEEFATWLPNAANITRM